MSDCFYFGCWNEPGHFLFRPNGWQAYGSAIPKDFPCREGALDAGFLPPHLPQIAGQAVLVHFPAWTILAFWDRSVDDRYGCNSAFILRSVLTFEEAVKQAMAAFPSIWARYTFPIVEYKP